MSACRAAAHCLFLVLYANAAPAEVYRTPRLDDSHVNLQGVWNLSNLTPLERPKGFDRLVISPVEAATIDSRIIALRNNQATGGQAAEFDEQRQVEPILGEFRSSVVVCSLSLRRQSSRSASRSSRQMSCTTNLLSPIPRITPGRGRAKTIY